MQGVGPARKRPPSTAQTLADGREGLRAEIGDVRALHPAPHTFDGVEIGRVGGQAHDGEPELLPRQVRTGLQAPVRMNTVPEEDDVSANVAPQMPDEAHTLRGPHSAGM